MSKETEAMLLAAGKGQRLGLPSGIPKPLVELGGRSLISYPMRELHTSAFSQDSITAVIGYGHDKLTEYLQGDVKYVYQEQQTGNGDAVLLAAQSLGSEVQTILTINADDGAFIQDRDYASLLLAHERKKAKLSILLTETFVKGTHRQAYRLGLNERVTKISRFDGLMKGEKLGFFAGVLAIDRDFLDAHVDDLILKKGFDSEVPITRLFPYALYEKGMYAHLMKSDWVGINTPDKLALARYKLDKMKG